MPHALHEQASMLDYLDTKYVLDKPASCPPGRKVEDRRSVRGSSHWAGLVHVVIPGNMFSIIGTFPRFKKCADAN